jgi:hypothetical protein
MRQFLEIPQLAGWHRCRQRHLCFWQAFLYVSPLVCAKAGAAGKRPLRQ